MSLKRRIQRLEAALPPPEPISEADWLKLSEEMQRLVRGMNQADSIRLDNELLALD